MVVCFGNRLARPVLVDVTDDEVFKMSSERSFVGRHGINSRSIVAARLGLFTGVVVHRLRVHAGAVARRVLLDPAGL